jgi:hypothetical protein
MPYNAPKRVEHTRSVLGEAGDAIAQKQHILDQITKVCVYMCIRLGVYCV